MPEPLPQIDGVPEPLPQIDDLLEVLLDLFARELGQPREYLRAEVEVVSRRVLEEARARGRGKRPRRRTEPYDFPTPERGIDRRKLAKLRLGSLPPFDLWGALPDPSDEPEPDD